jgi:hypothetical protein
MPGLKLVKPAHPQDILDNVRQISTLLAAIIEGPGPEVAIAAAFGRLKKDQEEALADAVRQHWSQSIGTDYVEIWYWFNPTTLRHWIVFVADPPGSDDGGEESHYHSYPWLLYYRLVFLSDAWDRKSPWYSNLRGNLKILFYEMTGQKDKMTELFIELVGRLSLPAPKCGADDNDGDEGAPKFEAWDAMFLMVKCFNRIPAVPIKRAAEILEVDEKTVRNRIDRGDLEGIPRKGTMWVTLRSIKKYLSDRYRPTADFNVWHEVEKELKGKLGISGASGISES